MKLPFLIQGMFFEDKMPDVMFFLDGEELEIDGIFPCDARGRIYVELVRKETG